MRPTPTRILFSVLAIVSGTIGAITSQPVFFLVAVMAAALLASNVAATRRPLIRALGRFRSQRVQVLVWGSPPPDLSDTILVLTSVNVIGAGTHLFFQTASGRSSHLKIAQLTDSTIAPDSVVIGSARYVQWNGAKLKVTPGAPAVVVSLIESPTGDRPKS